MARKIKYDVSNPLSEYKTQVYKYVYMNGGKPDKSNFELVRQNFEKGISYDKTAKQILLDQKNGIFYKPLLTQDIIDKISENL